MTGPNDRVLPITRWVAAGVIPFLVAAFAILFGVPQETQRLFAWPLKPTMSAMMLGAAYAGGIYFFGGVLRIRQWSRVKVGFLPVITFASMLGIATLLHWDRFTHNHISFYAWAGLYFTAPFLILYVWFRNRPEDSGRADGQAVLIPQAVAWTVGGIGALTLAISLFLFLRPAAMIDVWPWTLSPLTARTVGAMFALPGVVGLSMAFDRRWRAAQLILQSQGFSILLILVAAARAWSEFDGANPASWLFVGGLAGMFVGIVALYASMEARSRR